MKRRLGLVGLITFALALAMVGCGDDGSQASGEDTSAAVQPPDGLVNDGHLTYGTSAGYPPFEFRDDNDELAGFDVELVEALAGLMGLTPDGQDQDFDALIPSLTGSRIDIINSALYITPEREESIDMVPYLLMGQGLVVKSGNPEGIGGLEDLSGLDVSVTRGAISEKTLTDFNESTLKPAGKPLINILPFPNNEAAMNALKAGRAVAFNTSSAGADLTAKNSDSALEVAAVYNFDTELGIGVRKGDAEMRRAIEESLEKFVESGDYAELLAKYGFDEAQNYFD